jgi:hypothetical protein
MEPDILLAIAIMNGHTLPLETLQLAWEAEERRLVVDAAARGVELQQQTAQTEHRRARRHVVWRARLGGWRLQLTRDRKAA